MNNQTQALEVIKTRRSIRAYTDQALTDEQINNLAQCALSSPSAMNVQPWKFIFVKNPDILHEIEMDTIEHLKETNNDALLKRFGDKTNNIFYSAPLVIFICVKKEGWSIIDAGIAAENLALAAHAMGLGSVIVGMSRIVFESKKADYWREKLQFTPDYDYAISVAIGHPNGAGRPRTLDESKLVFIE